MNKNIVFLVAGASSRMKKSIQNTDANISQDAINQANERSKGLISIDPDGRPILDYLMYNAKQAGYTHIYVVVGEDSKLFREFYGDKDKDNDFHGLKISFATQYIPEGRVKPFGTSDALFQTLEQFPELQQEHFTLCNGDNLYSTKCLEMLLNNDYPNTFAAYDRDAFDFPLERISSFAVSRLDDEDYLMNIVEKPTPEDIENNKDKNGVIRVSMNAFRFDGKRLYPYLKNCPIHPVRDEKELPTAVLNMTKDDPKAVKGLHISEHLPDLTSKADIMSLQRYVQENYNGKLSW